MCRISYLVPILYGSWCICTFRHPSILLFVLNLVPLQIYPFSSNSHDSHEKTISCRVFSWKKTLYINILLVIEFPAPRCKMTFLYTKRKLCYLINQKNNILTKIGHFQSLESILKLIQNSTWGLWKWISIKKRNS